MNARGRDREVGLWANIGRVQRRALGVRAVQVILVLAAGCVLACGEERAPYLDDGSGTTGQQVEGCDDVTYDVCDVSRSSCQKQLASVAACLFGGEGTPVVLPPVDVLTTKDFEEELLEAFEQAAEADAELERYHRGWQWVYEVLGLANEGSLEVENRAERTAANVAASYDPISKRITLVTPEEETDRVFDCSVFVHEIIHALQDTEHNLNRETERRLPTSDSMLVWRAMVEGEAELHQLRSYAGLLGVEPGDLDLHEVLTESRLGLEQWMLDEGEFVLDSWVVVPYGYGALWALDVWERDGAPGLRRAIDDPPDSVFGLLATVWRQDPDASLADTDVFDDPDDFEIYDFDVMGAWSVYVSALRDHEDAERASDLAAKWRADRLELFERADEGFSLRWHFVFADSESATEFVELHDASIARAEGEHAFIAISQAEDDAWLWHPLDELQ